MNASDILGSGPTPGIIGVLNGSSSVGFSAQGATEVSVNYYISGGGGSISVNGATVASTTATTGTNGRLEIFVAKGQTVTFSTNSGSTCVVSGKNIRQF